MPQRDIASLAGGRRETVIAALRRLIVDGYVTPKGPRALVKPYADHGETA